MTDYQITKAFKIAKHYGLKSQKRQALQEFNELCGVLLRRKDQINSKAEYKNDLIDEIADCYIMLQQLITLYKLHPSKVSERISFKLNRQLERIANEQEVAK